MKNRKWIGLAVIVVGTAALVVFGWLRWQHGQTFPTTENAYVGGDVFPVAPRVPGTLVAVEFRDNDRVTAGQVLARLDPGDYEVAVARADAAVAEAEAALALDDARIAGSEADLTAAESQAAQAHADRDRFQALEKRGSAPARQSEEATTAAAVADARVEAARKALKAAQAKLELDRRKVAKARTEKEHADLQLSYCTITAPTDGVVADKSAAVGAVVAPGQPLGRVVPLSGDHVWIDANFKETQLHRIEVGQPVTFTVDAVADHEFHGTIAALSPGTGAAFALLPPENATGNWVKIVQRLPVRVAPAPDDPANAKLRLGLSAEVTVDTREPGERR